MKRTRRALERHSGHHRCELTFEERVAAGDMLAGVHTEPLDTRPPWDDMSEADRMAFISRPRQASSEIGALRARVAELEERKREIEEAAVDLLDMLEADDWALELAEWAGCREEGR